MSSAVGRLGINLIFYVDSFICIFIDDIFLIWTESKEEQKFLHDINEVHNSIKFESTYSKKSVHFLDTTVFSNKDHVLSTTLHTKPTDCHNCLQDNFYYAKAQKDNNIEWGVVIWEELRVF